MHAPLKYGRPTVDQTCGREYHYPASPDSCSEVGGGIINVVHEVVPGILQRSVQEARPLVDAVDARRSGAPRQVDKRGVPVRYVYHPRGGGGTVILSLI